MREPAATARWNAMSTAPGSASAGVTAARVMRAISNGEARRAASRARAGSNTVRNSMISIGLVPLAKSPPSRTSGAGRRPARAGSSSPLARSVSRARRSRCRFTCNCSAMARSEGIEPVSATMPRTASISGCRFLWSGTPDDTLVTLTLSRPRKAFRSTNPSPVPDIPCATRCRG